MGEQSYKIYSASAGSGKTSTLVEEYLGILLANERPREFRKVLAITFTNKAVNEMKERILWSLQAFSTVPRPPKAEYMFESLKDTLGLSEGELKDRASRRLKEILHNYAFFDVSTIDKFNHRLIRTFARDLKLPQNFEVVLDTEQLLSEAVNRVLNKAGNDDQLTRFLIEFSIEKTEADKSWDLSHDLRKIGKLIFEENHARALDELHNFDLKGFTRLQSFLAASKKKTEEEIRSIAAETLALIEANGLEPMDFSRGSFPKWLAKVSEGIISTKFDTQWQQKFGQEDPYAKSKPEATKATIDGLMPSLTDSFNAIRRLSYHYSFLENAYRNMVPLTVLNVLHQEVRGIQLEKDQLPIAFFNTLISDAIRDQPAPFIYERLGERYRHYFIDEFQDTSGMQWHNLVPLVGSALEGVDEQGEAGSLMLVGDAKQAIYRWRGGKAEQFMDLFNERSSPFVMEPELRKRGHNYRSHETIIRFNNDFFSSIGPLLAHPDYRELYLEGNQQKASNNREGLVSLRFLDPPRDEKDLYYCQAVSSQIRELLGKGYQYADICILTRRKKEGVMIADHLVGEDIPIISSESLLLASHHKVIFLVNFLRLIHDPKDQEAAYEVLYYLAGDETLRNKNIAPWIKKVEVYLRETFEIELRSLQTRSAYDLVEELIRTFDLARESDAYLAFLLDEALILEQEEDGSIYRFLQHWEEKKEKLSIAAPEKMNAIQVMTVHKAKGLEFPIVIYPYAITDIYNSRMSRETRFWIPVNPDEHFGFPSLMINKCPEMLAYGEAAADIYEQEQRKLELDAYNLLYVALTRPVKALYIISEKNDQLHKETGTPKYYSGLFIHFLKQQNLWQEEQEVFEFGSLPPAESTTDDDPVEKVPFPYTAKDRPSFRILTHGGNLWDTERGEAIERGTFVHLVLSEIHTETDLPPVLDELKHRGEINEVEYEDLITRMLDVIRHPQLSEFFEKGLEVRNETGIITSDGVLLRPDRLVITGKGVSILDYKTGKPDPRYHEQLYAYSDALEEMGYQINHRVLVYINDTVNPEFI